MTYIKWRSQALTQAGFTLAEEARNTERHQSFWNTDQKLRHTTINFVSAGTLNLTKEKEEEADDAMANMTLEDKTAHQKLNVTQGIDGIPEEIKNEGDKTMGEVYHDKIKPRVKPPPAGLSLGFVVDTQGSQPVSTGLPPPRLRSVSPASSSSSEEIFFGGRDAHGRAISREPRRPTAQRDAKFRIVEDRIKDESFSALSEPLSQQLRLSRRPTDEFDARIRIVEDQIHKQEELLEEVLHEKRKESPVSIPQSSEKYVDLEALLPRQGLKTDRRGRKKRRLAKQEDTDDAMIADYIANMDQDDIDALRSFGARELGGTEDDIWLETEASSGEPSGEQSEPAAKKPSRSDWSRDEICDFDELSTSDEDRGEVQEILSKRTRKSGLQYLVVWKGTAVDEARWVPIGALGALSAMKLIKAFEAEEKLVVEFQAAADEDTSNSDSDELDDEEDDDDELEDQLDEADLLQRKQERMSDERIARLLAKQEELGLGSDELLLFDDDEDAEENEEFFSSSFSFHKPSRAEGSNKSSGRRARRPRGDFGFPTDQYGGFDPMDRDRPSLQRKPKGSKGKIVYNVSDSELEATMVEAWENDRIKKKERKQEREELRAQGLLGKNGKPDLKQKYKEGMGIHAVKEEIKVFLLSSHTTYVLPLLVLFNPTDKKISLALPPMDKADRKVVHDFANAFSLKSKSSGTARSRFPVLYKTQRSGRIVFDSQAIDRTVERLGRRFLSRQDIGSSKFKSRGPRVSRTGGGGAGGGYGGGYRDGDIVGASAPELGAESKGHKMLEKLGWKTGDALGALGNKGIMQPVTHVVKTSKAGLG